MTTFFFDDGDDNNDAPQPDPIIESKDLGDDIGTKIGEGNDPIVDDVS